VIGASTNWPQPWTVAGQMRNCRSENVRRSRPRQSAGQAVPPAQARRADPHSCMGARDRAGRCIGRRQLRASPVRFWIANRKQTNDRPDLRSWTHSGPRAHRIAFRKVAVLDHRDTSKRERRSIVAQRHAAQGAEGITRFERTCRSCDERLHLNTPPLLLPPFDFRCQTISRPTTSDEQRMGSRFSHEAREFAQMRRFQKP
jgi:hypothetical protein